MKKFDKEFMLIFDNDQEHLISVPKLRWVYQHGLYNIKYYKEVDRDLSVRQFESIHNNPDNGYYCFYYNGALITDFTINRYEHKNLIKINITDRFPGYHEGHHADQQTGDTPQAEPSRGNGIGEGERPERHHQQQHPGFRPTSEHVRRSENLMSREETSLSIVDRLTRESIQVIPLELVRIDKPALVLVKVPETGEENRYMMTLTPIARS